MPWHCDDGKCVRERVCVWCVYVVFGGGCILEIELQSITENYNRKTLCVMMVSVCVSVCVCGV